MVKPSADDIKKQVEEQDDEVYGEGSVVGHAPDPDSDDDIGKIREEFLGEELKSTEELNLASEIVADEKSRHTKPDSVDDDAEAVAEIDSNDEDGDGDSTDDSVVMDDDLEEEEDDTPEVPLEEAEE